MDKKELTRITFEIPKEMHHRLKIFAAQQKTTCKNILTSCIDLFMDSVRKQNK